MTHKELIRSVLVMRGHTGATAREIERLTDIPYPARRIHEMRREGLDIRTEMVRVGRHSTVARYTLHPLPERGLRLGVRS
jgi:hypothetical protein